MPTCTVRTSGICWDGEVTSNHPQGLGGCHRLFLNLGWRPHGKRSLCLATPDLWQVEPCLGHEKSHALYIMGWKWKRAEDPRYELSRRQRAVFGPCDEHPGLDQIYIYIFFNLVFGPAFFGKVVMSYVCIHLSCGWLEVTGKFLKDLKGVV